MTTSPDYRYEADPEADISTPRALPRLTPTQSDALLIETQGHSITIGELDGMQFYRVCRSFMRERPKLWGILRQQFTIGEVDQVVRWNMVLELLAAGVVSVVKGMLVVKGEQEVAA